jgi:hypothetical protein
MALTRDAWYDHLLHGTGPLAPDEVEKLAPKPALLSLLREQVALPWPEFEEPEREDENDAPFYAMLLLGLLRDEEAIPSLIALASYSVDEDWEAVTAIGPAVLGAIGPAALPHLFAELERLEREGMLDAAAIDRDDLDDTELYTNWQLVISVEQVGLNHPETHADIARFAAERIGSRTYDRDPAETSRASDDAGELEIFVLPTPAEIWADLQASLRLPQLTPVVDEFFERHGPAFVSDIFGTRAQYDALFDTEAPTGNARERLMQTYRDLLDPVIGDEDDDEYDEEDEDDDDEDDDEDDVVIETYVRPEPKVGRNDPCPCGSGKKYKKCHGA